MKVKERLLTQFNTGVLYKKYAAAALSLFITCLFFTFTANGQYQIVKPTISGKRYPPSISSVAQDSRGFIWYLTHDGLYRYDGQHSVYLKRELNNLGFNAIPEQMVMDPNDHLWLAAKGCVACLDIKNWKIFSASQNLLKSEQADDIRDMEMLPNGNVIIGYKSGYILLGNYKGFQKIDAIFKRSVQTGKPLSVEFATYWKNAYWISTTLGMLFRVDATLNEHTVEAFPVTTENKSITKLMPWKEKMTCKSIDGTLYDFDGSKLSSIPTNDLSTLTKQNTWHDIFIRCNQSYIYLDNRGLGVKSFFLLPNGTLKSKELYIDSAGLLSDVYINSLDYNEKKGTIIIGSNQGIYILFKSSPKIPQFNPLSIFPNKSVRGIYCFPDGDIFYAGYSGTGVQSKRGSSFSDLLKAVYCVYPLDNNRLLLGIEGGFLKTFDRKKHAFDEVSYHIEKRYEPFSKFVFTIVENRGKYYLGTINGIWVLDSLTRDLYPLQSRNGRRISSGLTIKRLLWHHDSLYIASQKGLYVWSGNDTKLLFPRNIASGQSVYDIADYKNGLWLATLNQGLIRLSYSGKEIKKLNSENGLNTNVIFSLLNTGELLIAGTDQGLVLVKKDSIRLIGQEDGLQQLEFNHGASFYDTKRKIAYMGGLDGYTQLDITRNWFKNEPLKSIYIGNVSISGVKQLKSQEIYNLSYTSNLSVKLRPEQEYISVSIATPLSYVHRYDLEYTLNSNPRFWQKLDEGQPISLLGLSPGHYTLRVRSVGDIKPEKMLELGIQKMPEFYQTWWFDGLLLICVAGIAWLWNTNRIQKVRQESMLRTRIASDLHDEVGGVLTGISLQADFLVYTGVESNISYLKQIAESSREAVLTMGDIVWSVDARNDNTEELFSRMRDYLVQALNPLGMQSTFDSGDDYPALPQLIRQNTYLIFKEAINNIIKHSGATFVKVTLKWENKLLKLVVADNGRGIGKNPGTTGQGQGLSNMKMRAKRMKARFTIASEEPGTSIILEVPLKK